jgi:hypothetical protein
MRRRLLILVAVCTLAVGVAIGAGAAYGYFTSSGSGSGSATTGTMQTVTVATAGTPSAPLLPGGSGDVVFSVTNSNNFAVSVAGVALKGGGSITPDAGHSGCTTTDSNPVVTLNVPSGDLPVSIPANSTVPIDLANAASMDRAATNNCQGATFNIPVTITVHSS